MKGLRWHGPKDLRVNEHGILSLSKNPGARYKLPPLVLGYEFYGVIARKQGRVIIAGGHQPSE